MTLLVSEKQTSFVTTPKPPFCDRFKLESEVDKREVDKV